MDDLHQTVLVDAIPNPSAFMRFAGIASIFLFTTAEFCTAAPLSLPLPSSCRQAVIAIAPSWDSPTAQLTGFRRSDGAWHLEFGPIPILLGKQGLAWGNGIAGQAQNGLQKQERDWRSPAGIFKIGKLYTYDRTLPSGIKYPFYTITERDVWISDPQSPNYNRHLTVDLKNPPPWYKRERMRLGDPPHQYMLEIRHNSDPPIPGAGSAIFFHIQRGPRTATSGCTALRKEDLLGLLRWLRSENSPYYILLPRDVYKAKWEAWKLPAPSLVFPPQAKLLEGPIKKQPAQTC